MNRSTCKALAFILGFALVFSTLDQTVYAAEPVYKVSATSAEEYTAPAPTGFGARISALFASITGAFSQGKSDSSVDDSQGGTSSASSSDGVKQDNDDASPASDDNGTGSGSDTGNDSETDTGSGSGSTSETGTGANSESTSGTGTGTDSGNTSGTGADTNTGTGTGSNTGTGTGESGSAGTDTTDPATESNEYIEVTYLGTPAISYSVVGKTVGVQDVIDFCGLNITEYKVTPTGSDSANLTFSDDNKTVTAKSVFEPESSTVKHFTVTDTTNPGKSYTFNVKCKAVTTAKKIEQSMLGGTLIVELPANTAYTYTGEEIEPEATVKYDSVTLKEDTDYTVTYRNNINAGTAAIYISGVQTATGGYVGTVKKEFNIEKAKIEPVPNVLYYSGIPQALVSVPDDVADRVTFSLDEKGSYSKTIPTGTDANAGDDSYVVYYKYTSSNEGNYKPEAGSGSVSVKIKPLPISIHIKGNTKTVSYNGSKQTVQGWEVTSLKDGKAVFTVDQEAKDYLATGYKLSLSSSKITYGLGSQPVAEGTAVGTYQMNLTSTDFSYPDSNYKLTVVVDSDGYLTITAGGQTMSITASNVTATYDGNSHKITVNGAPSGATIKYGTSLTNLSTTHPTVKNVGKTVIYYQVTADGYDEYNGKASITITPKVAELSWPSSYSSTSKPTVSNLASGDSCSVTTSSKQSGTTVSVTAVGLSNDNYTLNGTSTKSKNYTSAVSNTTSSSSRGTTTKSTTTTGTSTTSKTTSGTTGTTTSSKSTTSSGTTSSSSSKTTGSTGSSTSSSTSSGSKSSGSTGSSLSDLDTTSDSDTGSSSSTSLPGTGLMTMDELNAAADDIANGGTGKSTSDLSSLLAENAVDEADLYEDDEDYYYDDDDYYEDDYYVDYDIYDSDGMMTYGRMVHLADPERYPVILAITLSILILCLAAGIVFLILSIRNKSSDTH